MQTDEIPLQNKITAEVLTMNASGCTNQEIFAKVEALLSQQREQVLEEVIRKIARAFPVKKEGDIGLMVLKHEGELKPSTSLGLIE